MRKHTQIAQLVQQPVKHALLSVCVQICEGLFFEKNCGSPVLIPRVAKASHDWV